jgi:multicomponent Na+:H+ antiporter subunit B
MKTIILGTAIRVLIPVFQIFSLYILFRGHNHPGGGFIGGLVGSIAFIFYIMAYGPKQAVHTFFDFRLFHNQKLPHQSRARYYFHLVRLNTWRRKKAESELPLQHKIFRLEPMYLMATGLFMATTSGIFGFFINSPYMTALWTDFYLPILGRPGTPILFDIGVYMLVIGIVLKITFVMSEE